MIKSFEELGDVLAEFENRIRCLEMSTNRTRELEAGKADPPVVTYEHRPHIHKYTEVKRGTDTF